MRVQPTPNRELERCGKLPSAQYYKSTEKDLDREQGEGRGEEASGSTQSHKPIPIQQALRTLEESTREEAKSPRPQSSLQGPGTPIQKRKV